MNFHHPGFGISFPPEAVRLTKVMSFMEVAYSLKNPVACPTAQERLESWKTIQPKRIQRKKL